MINLPQYELATSDICDFIETEKDFRFMKVSEICFLQILENVMHFMSQYSEGEELLMTCFLKYLLEDKAGLLKDNNSNVNNHSITDL